MATDRGFGVGRHLNSCQPELGIASRSGTITMSTSCSCGLGHQPLLRLTTIQGSTRIEGRVRLAVKSPAVGDRGLFVGGRIDGS